MDFPISPEVVSNRLSTSAPSACASNKVFEGLLLQRILERCLPRKESLRGRGKQMQPADVAKVSYQFYCVVHKIMKSKEPFIPFLPPLPQKGESSELVSHIRQKYNEEIQEGKMKAVLDQIERRLDADDSLEQALFLLDQHKGRNV